jgi:secreted PhoX family phosphatase
MAHRPGITQGSCRAGPDQEGRAAPLAGRFTLTEAGGTNFLRPEDGHWDVKNPNIFYFLTTDRLTSVKDADGEGRSRLYKMTFDDIKKPMAGGTIEALLSGTEGYEMLDNMTVSNDGTLILQEDVGNNPRLGKIWHFNPTTRKLSEIAVHDAARFTKGAAGFLTEDEESSGVIEVTDLLTKASRRYADGRHYYLISVQAHYATDAELVEGGQLVLLASPKK